MKGVWEYMENTRFLTYLCVLNLADHIYNERGRNIALGYVGKSKNGEQHGQGTYTYADGSKYVGKWKNGKQHGQGTGTSSDGLKYVGKWKNGKEHGQGTRTFPDGRKYVGKWKNGKEHGGNIHMWRKKIRRWIQR